MAALSGFINPALLDETYFIQQRHPGAYGRENDNGGFDWYDSEGNRLRHPLGEDFDIGMERERAALDAARDAGYVEVGQNTGGRAGLQDAISRSVEARRRGITTVDDYYRALYGNGTMERNPYDGKEYYRGETTTARNPFDFGLAAPDMMGDLVKAGIMTAMTAGVAGPALTTAFGGGTLGAMGAGATLGGVTSGISGGDPLKGALMGGVGGALAPALSSVGVTNPIAQGAISGGIKSTLSGADPITGVISGAANAGFSQLGKFIPDSWKNIGNTVDGEFTRVDDGAPPEFTYSADSSTPSSDADINVTQTSVKDGNMTTPLAFSDYNGAPSWLGGPAETDPLNPYNFDLPDTTPAFFDWENNTPTFMSDEGTINPGWFDTSTDSSGSGLGGVLSSAVKWLLGSGAGAAAGGGTMGSAAGGGGIPPLLGLALGAGLFENPDRTTTTKVEFPPEYMTALNKALGLADQVAANGAGIVAPLDANEQQALDLARTSAGGWKSYTDRASALNDEGATAFRDASRLEDKAADYFRQGGDAANTAFGYMNQADQLGRSVPGYLARASERADAAMPYFTKAGQSMDSVNGFLDRATKQVDASKPYFDQAGAMAGRAGGYMDEAADLTRQGSRSITDLDPSEYMNPYLEQVLDPILRRAEIAKAQDQIARKAKAGMHGAFGGTADVLDRNLAAESYDRNTNELQANVRASAYDNALKQMAEDLARQLQGGQQFNTLAGTANTTASTYGSLGKSVADIARTFLDSGNLALNTGQGYSNIGKSVNDTAATYLNAGKTATDAAGMYGTLAGRANETGNTFANLGRGVTDTANAKTSTGRAFLDAGDNMTNLATAFGSQTNADVDRLLKTGGTARSVEQARRAAPLTGIDAYTRAMGNAPKTTTTTAAAPSKLGQATGILTALAGAQKAGVFG